MNNYKNKVWSIFAGIIFAFTTLVTVGLLVKVAGLNMLPGKYFGLAVFAVVFLLLIIFAFAFLLPWKRKKETSESSSQQKNALKKNIGKYVLRAIALLLAILLMIVDVVGVRMIDKFEETMSNLVENEEEKVEEFVFGVYVLVDDKAETIEDAKRYDFGYSLGYDRHNTQKAIGVLEEALNRSLNLEEYNAISDMIDAVLAGEKDAFILNAAYLDILREQEGYADLLDKVKCIHEWVVTTQTEVADRLEDAFDITKDTFIVYVSGHDTDYAASRANSDVNIMAVVNPTTKQVLLVNTPRDFFVPISVSEEGALDKLTHCGIYGVECSMDTLDAFYDVDIKYYAQLNFKGFVRLIDAVGGISVYCEKYIDTGDGYIFKKGMNYFNGDQALRFVRERKQFGDGDHARGRHQMAVIEGLIQKMSSGSLLRNYGDIMDSMGKYFKCSLSQEEISALVKMQLTDMSEWNVQSYAVTGTGSKSTCYSLKNLKTYVMIPDEASVEHAKTLIQMVYDGETIEDEDLKVPATEE